MARCCYTYYGQVLLYLLWPGAAVLTMARRCYTYYGQVLQLRTQVGVVRLARRRVEKLPPLLPPPPLAPGVEATHP